MQKIWIANVDKWGRPYIVQCVIEKETEKFLWFEYTTDVLGKFYPGRRISKDGLYETTLTDAWIFVMERMEYFIEKKEKEMEGHKETLENLEILFHAKGYENA